MAYKKLHMVMYPWFAVGHMTPFLHLSNKLAENGHKITFVLPNKAITILQPLNLHPSLIKFRPITVPHVEPLPRGAETGSDIPLSQHTHPATALDLTRPEFESILKVVKPDLVFYDAAYWALEVASKYGIKSVSYNVVCASVLALNMVPARKLPTGRPVTVKDVASPPPGYPSSTVVLEPKRCLYVDWPFGDGLKFYSRITSGLKNGDVIAIRTIYQVNIISPSSYQARCYPSLKRGRRLMANGPSG